tara:strand:- start:179 stop:457 length:279 start_codon:yes stop_codon:yes gene_type:complete
MKKILSIFILLLAYNNEVKSLNLFELSMVGLGAGLVYNQYFDKSLTGVSEFKKKYNVIDEYYSSQAINIDSRLLDVPIQQQLLIIEEIHLIK